MPDFWTERARQHNRSCLDQGKPSRSGGVIAQVGLYILSATL